MSKLTGEVSRRAIDRNQWSNLDKQRADLLVKGRGEGLVEVYFGKGFASPPTFNYSAVFNETETEVLSYAVTPPRGTWSRQLDMYGMPNDSMSQNGFIQDPSFESQGKYRVFSGTPWFLDWTVIPDAYEAFLDIDSIGALPLADWQDSVSLTNQVGPKYGDSAGQNGPHRWVQTGETRERWALTDSAFHDLGVGMIGNVSAQSLVGPSGYTNWLVPFDYSESPITYSLPVQPNDYWTMWHTVWEVSPTNVSTAYGGGVYAPAEPPPYIRGFKGFAYVKCDSDVELQVNASYIHFSGGFGSGVVISDSTLGEPFESTPTDSLRLIDSVDVEVNSVGTGWRRVDFEIDYPGPISWPDAEYCANVNDLPINPWWVLRLRVKGTPGATVNLDNVYIDRVMKNAELPIMTIGVAEWIRDEQGVYVGAKLWVVRGEASNGSYCVEPS